MSDIYLFADSVVVTVLRDLNGQGSTDAKDTTKVTEGMPQTDRFRAKLEHFTMQSMLSLIFKNDLAFLMNGEAFQ